MTCCCGHAKSEHIYEEGACRPAGVVCLCVAFTDRDPLDRELALHADAGPDPDAVHLLHLHREAERHAHEALRATQARNQAVCDLYDGDRWTHQRIAGVLGVTVGRVGQIIRAHQNSSGSVSPST